MDEKLIRSIGTKRPCREKCTPPGKKPKLNENQQIVLEWLKEELNDSYFKSAVSNLFFWVRYDNVEGFPNERSHKMVQAFEELDDKDFAQVLATFAEWGMKEVAE